MSRTVSVDLQTHLEGPVLTMVLCYKLTRRDATEYFFTTHNDDLPIDGDVYSASKSFQPTQAESKAGLSIDNMELTVPIASGGIEKADIVAGLLYGAELDVFWVNWGDLTDGKMYEAQGWRLGKHILKENRAVFEVRSLASFLKAPALDVISPDCPYQFGLDDGLRNRCPAVINDYMVTGSVNWQNEDEPKRIFTDANRSEATDIWQYGLITWTSGNNSGYSMEIESFDIVDSEITLLFDMPYDIDTGDEFNLWQGCDKQFATCKAFGFQDDFGGYPNVPDQDTALQYAAIK